MPRLGTLAVMLSVGASALALSACGTFPGAAPRTPEQRQEDRATLELLLRHCDLNANVDMELGLSARTGFGLKAGGTCGPSTAPPPPPTVTPLSELR